MLSAYGKAILAAIAQAFFQLGGVIGAWVLCLPIDRKGLLPIAIMFVIVVPCRGSDPLTNARAKPRCHTARGGSSFREGRTRGDLGILHSAGLWLDLHGDDAIPQARKLVASRRERGDLDGADRWLRIIRRARGDATGERADIGAGRSAQDPGDAHRRER